MGKDESESEGGESEGGESEGAAPVTDEVRAASILAILSGMTDAACIAMVRDAAMARLVPTAVAS